MVVLTTANGLIRLSKMSDILFDRSRLGMSLEIFSSTRDEPVFTTAVQNLKEIDNSMISILPSAAPVQIIIIDEQYVLICDLKPDDLRDDGQDVAFLIQSSELAEMMESLDPCYGNRSRRPAIRESTRNVKAHSLNQYLRQFNMPRGKSSLLEKIGFQT